MTLTLKKQLTLLCAAAIVGGALWKMRQPAQAQFDPMFRTRRNIKEPRLTLARDVAAQQFVALLNSLNEPYNAQSQPNAAMMSSFSRSSENENLASLLTIMAKQLHEPERKVTVQSEGERTATVVVETLPAPVSRPLVLIQEGEGWGVDVVETYAKWNNLEGPAKATAIAALTTELSQASENARRSSCQSNLKQISLGILQYTQDYDEKLPLAKPWVDILQPYLKSEQLFNCPSVTDPKGFGYAYNAKLSATANVKIPNPSATVSIYETQILKRNAYGVGDFPAFRHLGGANYAYADGHVKWLAKGKTPSFNLKP